MCNYYSVVQGLQCALCAGGSDINHSCLNSDHLVISDLNWGEYSSEVIVIHSGTFSDNGEIS